MTEDLGQGPSNAYQIDKVCHDLRQSIATGLLLSELMDGERLDANETRRLSMLRQQWEQVGDLVTALSEQHGGRRHFQTDLEAVCRLCVDSMPTAHDVALHADSEDHTVSGDPVLLRRAVANLLDNALRATAVAGRVRVCVGSSETDCWVEVSDDGPGFGEIAARTGFGLEIVRAAVWAGSGRLRIETGPTSGTSVRITFPVALRSVS